MFINNMKNKPGLREQFQNSEIVKMDINIKTINEEEYLKLSLVLCS